MQAAGQGAAASRPAAESRAASNPATRPFIQKIGRDLDGDGCADFALPGTPALNNEKGGQTVTLYSGKRGAEIMNIRVSASTTAERVLRDEIVITPDRDGDGAPDLLIYPWSDRGQMLEWVSGKTGESILKIFTPAGIPSQRPAQMATVDLNADGVDDILFTNPDGAGAISGASGDGMFRTKKGGIHLCISGDLNLDGKVDFVTGGDLALRSRQVFVYSGADGSELLKIDCGGPPGPNAGAIAAPGDINGDGIVDFTVGSPREVRADYHAGTIRNYSGATGGCFRETKLDRPFTARFGEQVALAGDVAGDGTASLFVTAPRIDGPGARPAQESGMVTMLLPRVGSFLWTRYGESAGDQLGQSLRVLGDVDGDGIADAIVSSKFTKEKRDGFLILSGRTGAVIHRIYR